MGKGTVAKLNLQTVQSMRIIAGIHRGRKIEQPELTEARPTKDRVRESVFNIVAPNVPGSTVLDIFAGSGAYGLEALSRGANEAVFVDNNRRCTDIIEENLNKLKLYESAEIVEKDVKQAIELIGAQKKQFSLIFADPPYNKDLAKNVLLIINQYDILSAIGFCIVEHHVNEDIPEVSGNVSLCKQKTYGKTVISVFKHND